MDSLCQIVFPWTVCDIFNNASDLTGKIVCDVPMNGNVFLGATVWDVHTNGKHLAGTNCVECTCDRKQFRRIIVFLALLYVFPYLSARRSHTTSFCRACVPGGHIPDGFWVMWEGPPYRPHSLGDGSKCHRGKGLKPFVYHLHIPLYEIWWFLSNP